MPLPPNSAQPARPPVRASEPSVLVNPQGSLLGSRNAILAGSGRRHYVPDFEGCISVKTVVSGSAAWETGRRRFVLHEHCYLILNDRQVYTITIDSLEKVTTFCLFFQRGFVEDVLRSSVTPSAALLDNPNPARWAPVGFMQKIEPGSSEVMRAVHALRALKESKNSSEESLEQGFTLVAEAMVREHYQTEQAIAQLPALRRTTREELYRRALRGRDLLLSSLDRNVSLRSLAREAFMSPYHFHRIFTRIFGETPHRYLTRQRLNRAAHLLAQTDRSVTEICLEAGFESLGSFSSLFHRHFGMPPSDARGARRKACFREAALLTRS